MNKSTLWGISLALLAGCGSDGTTAGDRNDASIANADLGTPDLAIGPDLAAADGPGVAMIHHYVINKLQLPGTQNDFAFDLNGDGKPDNQLGTIIDLLQADSLDPQSAEDSAVQAGLAIHLLSLSTTDPAEANDPSAFLTQYIGQQTTPDYSGTGLFNIDPNVPKAAFTGTLANSLFTSTDPKLLTNPPTAEISVALSFVPNSAPLVLPLHGGRITSQNDGVKITGGQINGAIKSSDVQSLIYPYITAQLNAVAQTNPCDSNCMEVRAQFDTNGDGTVSLSEVQMNSLIQLLFKSDVRLFDANGNWAPDKTNANPDSLSVGLAFTAVGAQFNE